MRFRFRLAFFLVVALVGIQVLTGALVYSVTRHELIDEGKRQLGVASAAFVRQLDDVSARVAASVQVLALDYALRSAIAQRDQATVRSALQNHGRRVGAARMQLVGVDGRIEADTATPGDGHADFAYPDLLDRALDQPAAAVVAWQGRAYWVVVVPVFAPDLVGAIAAMIPLDDALLRRLQGQSVLPRTMDLASANAAGGWQVLARGDDRASPTRLLGPADRELPETAQLHRLDGREYLVQAVQIARSKNSPAVAAVLAYSVDEALQPYRTVATAWAALLSLGLVIGVVGAFLIARRVSQPVEQLAESARRIEAGDYRAPPPMETGDEIGALASAFANMTLAIREREARILHQAGHDQVTGLPNRLAAEASIRDDRTRHAERSAALLMVGLRRLPEIVKTLGHDVGDRLMREAGERLREIAGEAALGRATDTEFSIFLPGIGKQEAIAFAFRAIDALSLAYQESDLSLDMAPAVGIALAPGHGNEASVLVRRAGVALIAALESEEPAVVYDLLTDPHRPERLSLMGELRQALEGDQLQLHYQAKLNLRSGRIDGAEGLVRWQHPRLGAVQPDAFIPMAEETGNIRRLTRWALAAGIVQAQRWNQLPAGVRVAINVSARDLNDDDLPRRIAGLLAVHGVSPRHLMLEVTESAVMANPDAAIQTLRRLADQGIDLAIDDFGVGQSSFAYLRRLPVRELKIDRLFIQRIAEAAADRAIVRSIVELGHHLGYGVTAEGVENRETLDYLASIGCDHAQGYWIARPLPVAAFETLLAARSGPAERVRA
jgi:diguanylate cyclase (GGDEF)-like protein